MMLHTGPSVISEFAFSTINNRNTDFYLFNFLHNRNGVENVSERMIYVVIIVKKKNQLMIFQLCKARKPITYKI